MDLLFVAMLGIKILNTGPIQVFNIWSDHYGTGISSSVFFVTLLPNEKKKLKNKNNVKMDKA